MKGNSEEGMEQPSVLRVPPPTRGDRGITSSLHCSIRWSEPQASTRTTATVNRTFTVEASEAGIERTPLRAARNTVTSMRRSELAPPNPHTSSSKAAVRQASKSS